MVPHLGVRENNNLFRGFLKSWELNVERVVVDKTRTTYGHGLMDLPTYWQYTDCITKYGQIFMDTDLQFTDLTNHGPYYSRTWQSTDCYLNYERHLWDMKN